MSDFFKYTIKGKGCIPTQARTWVRNLQEEGYFWEDKIWTVWSSYPTPGGYAPWITWGLFFYLGRCTCFTVDCEISWRRWGYLGSTTPAIRGCKVILAVWSCFPEWPAFCAGRSVSASASCFSLSHTEWIEANVKPKTNTGWYHMWNPKTRKSWTHWKREWSAGRQELVGGGNGEMLVRGYKTSITGWVSSGDSMYSTVTVAIILHCVLEIC